MKGFKDSTKTQYAMGGSCKGYAKGGSVKGAAKISKVMGEFKSGDLHSGSKKGPVVTNPKQAKAIALSEARKAGAKIPLKKQDGGAIGRGNRSAALEQKEEAPLVAEGKRTAARDMKRGNPYTKPEVVRETRVTREVIPADPLQERLSRPVSKADMAAARRAAGKPTFRDIPLIGGALGTARDVVKAVTGYKNGGLTVMPKGKK